MSIIAKSLGFSLAFFGLIGAGVSHAEGTDNGTDPTKLRRMSWTSYEHLDMGHDVTRGTLKMMYESPVGAKTSLRLTLPVVGFDAPGVSDSYDLGDIALRATYILDVNRQRGLVLQGEIFGDTADRPLLGYDAVVLKATGIYAKFLPGGQIFAPALSHAEAVDGDGKISETTADFYYVPKLPNPAWYMTVDPALIKNWETEAFYGSLAVTTGRAVGKVGTGVAQAYLKPSILIGNERPADWGIEAGFRIIGF